MPRHVRVRYAGAKYHVTNRGHGRAKLFYHDADRERFMAGLSHALEADGVLLYAYCLMDNHFHLFVETPEANIDAFMRRMSTAYAMYFRYRHYRPGHCFQGRYKARVVDGDEYIQRLIRYIHLNPIEVRTMRAAEPKEQWAHASRYPWSSLPGYLRARSEDPAVDYRWLDGLGDGERKAARRRYEGFMKRQVGTRDEILHAALDANKYALGDEGFVAEIEEHVIAARNGTPTPSDRVDTALRPVELDALRDAVAEAFDLAPERLCARYRRNDGLARSVFIELACRLGGYSQREVAAYIGTVGEHAVGKARQALWRSLERDAALRRKINRICLNANF